VKRSFAHSLCTTLAKLSAASWPPARERLWLLSFEAAAAEPVDLAEGSARDSARVSVWTLGSFIHLPLPVCLSDCRNPQLGFAAKSAPHFSSAITWPAITQMSNTCARCHARGPILIYLTRSVCQGVTRMMCQRRWGAESQFVIQPIGDLSKNKVLEVEKASYKSSYLK